jgi:hypothetical protein
MKQFKSFIGIVMLMLVAFSCQKSGVHEEMQQKKPSLVMDGLTNTVWQSDCDKPYEITLFNIVDLGGGKYQWQWGIANLSGAADLSRISFKIPQCVTAENPKFAFVNQLEKVATVVVNDESYKNCRVDPTSGHKVFSFVIPTVGTGTTYFYLTLNTNKVEQTVGYFQNASGCGSTCFPGIKDDCSSCSFSQGRYFASPHAWPAPTVTVGGKTYTEAEGRAIWNSSNAGGKSDAKQGFTQVAAIKLSAATISSTATVWADVKIVEDWLSSLPKLTPTNVGGYNLKAVGQAAGRIGNWIDANHCK